MALVVKPSFQSRFWAALLVLPMLLLSAFPQGTMASRGANGFEVVLCTGDGPLTILVDENGTPIEEQYADAADCGWWLLNQSLIVAETADTVAPHAVSLRSAQDVSGDQIRPWRHNTHDPARAPPLV